jgi:hypothetical protein
VQDGLSDWQSADAVCCQILTGGLRGKLNINFFLVWSYTSITPYASISGKLSTSAVPSLPHKMAATLQFTFCIAFQTVNAVVLHFD